MNTHPSNGIGRHKCKNSPSNEDAILGNVSLSADSQCLGFLSFSESNDELPALFDDFTFVQEQFHPNSQRLCLCGSSPEMAAENEALSFSELLKDDSEDILESSCQLQSEFAPFGLVWSRDARNTLQQIYLRDFLEQGWHAGEFKADFSHKSCIESDFCTAHGCDRQAGLSQKIWSPGLNPSIFHLPTDADHEIDLLMGCAATPFPLIVKAGKLVQNMWKMAENSVSIVSQAMDLKALLEQWTPPRCFDSPEDSSSEVQHSIQLAHAYHWATVLYLNQVVPKLPSEPIKSLANRF
ncbi:hypothetical protein PDE_03446 [Penicillium oxalicum 114-2]|uniref:Transcription factor domain-containing protein n=1 Tax=Penicillium oxalicum (strain 114-2 / CGMCC 5302) TaxID=933388 RepID=S7ZCY6_PENO1|nr:hypothetical protein PDE_03446 [Penicillium oxalicum 114-2]